MKLTRDQRLVIQEMQFLAQQPIEAARRTRARLKHKNTETIRRTLQRASHHGLLTVVPQLDVGALGRLEFLILCSAESKARADRISTLLLQHHLVHHIARTTGSYDLLIVLRVGHSAETTQFLADMHSAGVSIKDRQIGCVTTHTLFSRTYLTREGKRECLNIPHSIQPQQLHPTEAEVALQLLPQSMSSKTQLAQYLGTSRGMLLHRLNSLRANGILHGWIYELNACRAGLCCYDILLTLSNCDEALKDALKAFVFAEPGVTALRITAGSFDIHISFECERPAEVHFFKQKLAALVHNQPVHLVLLNRWEAAFREESQTQQGENQYAA